MRCESSDMSSNRNRLVRETLSQEVSFLRLGIAYDEGNVSCVQFFHPCSQSCDIRVSERARIVLTKDTPRTYRIWGIHVYEVTIPRMLQNIFKVACQQASNTKLATALSQSFSRRELAAAIAAEGYIESAK